MKRRDFLLRLSSLVSISPLAFISHRVGAKTTGTVATKQIAGIAITDWDNISLVQEQLFPSEAHAPGAREIHATAYLQSVLMEYRQEDSTHTFLLQGLRNLENLCQQLYKQPFAQLDLHQRDAALTQLQQSTDGYNWIHMLLDYILEALLTDPVYGGNPHGIGWHWLHHQPGFPRPPTALQRRYL